MSLLFERLRESFTGLSVGGAEQRPRDLRSGAAARWGPPLARASRLLSITALSFRRAQLLCVHFVTGARAAHF